MMSIASIADGSKKALILISAIVIVSIVDSQFVNTFYGTDLDTPGNSHLVMFISFVIIISFINIVMLFFVKSNHLLDRTSRPKLLKIAYDITCVVQYTTLLLLFITIFEILAFHNYHRIWSILVIDLSHFWSAILVGVLAFTFIQWFKIVKSYSLLIYAVVFGVILFLTLITIPLLTEQFNYQSQLIYPRDYTTLIVAVTVPSKDIAFLYGLGNYVLPILLIASWILTVSILKPYMARTGKSAFWLLVSVPLLYQLFAYVIRDANLTTIPGLVDIIYTRQFQFYLGISYQISGLLFAIAYLTVARKMKRKHLQNHGSRLDTILETETKVSPKLPFIKRILIVDDDPDITLTFKAGLDGYYYCDGDKKKRFEVYTYNDPLTVLEEFKPHRFDLLLTDINMPNMNGFELCEKILGLDINIRVCFMSSLVVNIQALREVYPNASLGCFIEKPVSIKYLIERLSAELD